MRSRIEGTRPVRSGLPPPPSSPANLDREETRAGFPYSLQPPEERQRPGFCRSRRTARRAGRAQKLSRQRKIEVLKENRENRQRNGRIRETLGERGVADTYESRLFGAAINAENITNRTVKAPPKTGQNAAPGGISRPQLALRRTTWHYVAQDQPLHGVVGGCALSSEGVCISRQSIHRRKSVWGLALLKRI